jgi:glycosyltransferase involved in cell wall biosynthesis
MLTLSVISPAYNLEDYIVPFLESLCAQTWPDFELIIVDDASRDRTADLIVGCLPRLGSRTRFIQHEGNQGEMITVTEAFSKARGDICIKVDADSRLEPDTFLKLMQVFLSDEQVGVVGTLYGVLPAANWLQRGAEVLLVAQQRCDNQDEDHTIVYGTCFAFRRHIFSTEEISSRVDVDLAQLARKRGWKVTLRKDITVRTRYPAAMPGVFAHGRRMVHLEVPTYWHHREMLLTRWSFWAKFAPLGLVLTALFKPLWALLGLLGWLVLAQVFLACKAPDYSIGDRLSAWVVTLVRWIGFDYEVLRMGLRGIARRLRRR